MLKPLEKVELGERQKVQITIEPAASGGVPLKPEQVDPLEGLRTATGIRDLAEISTASPRQQERKETGFPRHVRPDPLSNTDDNWHDRAEAAWRGLIVSGTPLVTTSLVLFELGDGLSRVNHGPWPSISTIVYGGRRRFESVHAGPSRSGRPGSFRNRPDKTWGVTDCASFILMKEMGMDAALTVDHHFERPAFNG